MFAPISIVFLLLFLLQAPENAIHIAELPADGKTVEMVAGYGVGGLSGFHSTTASRSLTLTAYATGSDIKFFEDLDRTGIRIAAPEWSRGMFMEQLPGLFEEVPKQTETSRNKSDDFRAKIEDEIRTALLGLDREPVGYFTDRAFLLMTGPVPASVRDKIAAIPKRASPSIPGTLIGRLAAERTFRFKSDLATGGVVFAAPVPGVYYKEWYSVLLLDRLIHRAVPLKLSTALPLTVNPYYYRLEAGVPSGQFPEPVEENLQQELRRLQFTRARPEDLEAAREAAREYLETKDAREWFASHDISSRREEGIQWIQAMTADDMRVAARELLLMNRVIALWAPKVKETSVSVENLSSSPLPLGEGRRASSAPGEGLRPQPIPQTPFPPHTDSPATTTLAERLSSGISIAPGPTNAIFVAGVALSKFDRDPDADTVKQFQSYPADRVLVLTPASSMDRARQLWSSFKSANNTRDAAVAKGKVSTGDLPALYILKVLLDRKVIEAGWWSEVELRIDAGSGSELQIRAEDDKRSTILQWIHGIASDKPSDADLAWAREVAVHRFAVVRNDLQALIWERDPQGSMQDLETISAGHVSDVARIYF